jgi:hypothetical protein
VERWELPDPHQSGFALQHGDRFRAARGRCTPRDPAGTWNFGRRPTEVHGDTAIVAGSMHQAARGPEGAHPLTVEYRPHVCTTHRRLATRTGDDPRCGPTA